MSPLCQLPGFGACISIVIASVEGTSHAFSLWTSLERQEDKAKVLIPLPTNSFKHPNQLTFHTKPRVFQRSARAKKRGAAQLGCPEAWRKCFFGAKHVEHGETQDLEFPRSLMSFRFRGKTESEPPKQRPLWAPNTGDGTLFEVPLVHRVPCDNVHM